MERHPSILAHAGPASVNGVRDVSHGYGKNRHGNQVTTCTVHMGAALDRTAQREDASLVSAAQSGDMRSFEALVREYTPAVYGHALRFFGDPAAAEDVVQEVFVNVYRSLASFDGRSTFSTWLFRVTRNACLDMFRAGRKQAAPLDPLDIPDVSVRDFSDGVAMTTDLERALQAVAPEERDAFNAVALFGLTYAQAADVLGAPVGTVKSRVFRARKALIVMLGLGGGA
jgi:RNA polymerase sigma-70 factor (ECF subfamily)